MPASGWLYAKTCCRIQNTDVTHGKAKPTSLHCIPLNFIPWVPIHPGL